MSRLRYVILQHDYQGVHYDWMFETGGMLRTWKLSSPPQPGQLQPATLSFDHRLIYLDYEGPISGSRGHVVRWDAGTYVGDVRGESPIYLEIDGQRLRGKVKIRHIEGDTWEITIHV